MNFDKLVTTILEKHEPKMTKQEKKKQLKKGIEVETEHTGSKTKKVKLSAKDIAKAHLKEDPKYYDKLLKAKL